jgi:hypothetical protein
MVAWASPNQAQASLVVRRYHHKLDSQESCVCDSKAPRIAAGESYRYRPAEWYINGLPECRCFHPINHKLVSPCDIKIQNSF